MASDVPKQTKLVSLNLRGIKNKVQAKDLAADMIVAAILADSSNQRSSVTGNRWKSLTSKEYIKLKGSSTANLRLQGDMMGSLKSKRRTGDNIEVGIFKSNQQGKADGHNNLSGLSALPRRQFIPDEDEEFRSGIIKEVNSALDLLRGDDQLEGALRRLLSGN